MPTLRCSLSKEVRGEAGGRTAAVSLEVELSAETLKQPASITKHIRCGFDRVRAAIEEELGRADFVPITRPDSTAEQTAHRRNDKDSDRPITPNQLRLLKMLADRGDADLAALCRDRFGKTATENLSTREASRLIEQLNGSPNAKGRR